MRDVLVVVCVCVCMKAYRYLSPLCQQTRRSWVANASFHVDLPGSGSGHPARIRTVMYD